MLLKKHTTKDKNKLLYFSISNYLILLIKIDLASALRANKLHVHYDKIVKNIQYKEK